MKKSIQSILAAAAFAFTALAGQAQTAPKIVIVDLAKIFDNHYKTLEQQAKLQADEAKAKDQLDAITKEGNALVEQYKELDDQSKNPTATADAKAKAQADAQKKLDEIRQKQNEQQSFVQQTRNSLQQRFQTFKTLMLEEITKAVTQVAKEKGATLVLDKSGPTMVGVSSVVYFDPGMDITEEVMTLINKDRPAVTPAPVTSTAPAAAPASGDAPKITVPGITPSK
jgi:outer membrane protein